MNQSLGHSVKNNPLNKPLSIGLLIKVTLLVSLWVHLSEVFRYFVFITPALKASLPMIPDVAPMNLIVFMIWGAWDTLLTLLLVFTYYLAASHYQSTSRAIFVSAMIVWGFFWILWVGVINMGMGDSSLLIRALPLAGIEVLIAAWLSSKLLSR